MAEEPNTSLKASGGTTAGLGMHIDDALQAIKDAWTSGRRIVPLIGAGFSVDSGMPVVQGIERYLALLHLYIQNDVYLGLGAKGNTQGLFKEFCDHYRHEPDNFVRDFQWPDRFLIQQDLCNADLWEKYGIKRTDQQTVQNLINTSFQQLLRPALGWKETLLADGVSQDGGRLHDLFGNWRTLIERFTEFDEDLADALVQRLHEHRRPGTSHNYLAFLARMNLWRTILTFNFDPLIERSLVDQQMPHRVFAMERGHTFPHELLIQRGLSIVKMHGDTHRLLMDATLDRPLSKNYLTRLERCLVSGSRDHQSSPLILVLGCGGTEERCLSIIRHFRSRESHGFPNVPLAIWVHFEKTVPSALWNCLLPEERRKYLQQSDNDTGRDALQVNTDNLKSALYKSGIMTLHARNPGFFLMHLYSFLTTRHPASRVQYLAHIDRPIALWNHSASPQSSDCSSQTPVRVFDGRDLDPRALRGTTASQQLAEYVNSIGPEYHTLWIDLEDCYSVVDVVGRIVELARRYDATLAPGVFELDRLDYDSDNDTTTEELEVVYKNIARLYHKGEGTTLQPAEGTVIAKAVERIRRILRRGTYCLAFDSTEAFGWPPTSHHGEIECASATAFIAAHQLELIRFLDALCTPRDAGHLVQEHRGSIIAIAINSPKRRFTSDPVPAFAANEWYSALTSLLRQWQARVYHWKRISPTIGSRPLLIVSRSEPLPLPVLQELTGPYLSALSREHGGDSLALVLFRLAACRRTRQLVALRRLLRPVRCIRTNENVDRLLKELEGEEVVLRVEGGGFWMNRPLRDQLYSCATPDMDPAILTQFLNSPEQDQNYPSRECITRIAAQLWLVFAEHDRWADWYYDQNHLHSSDPHAFFEYVYHRTSALRAITVLVAWADRWRSATEAAILAVNERVAALVASPSTWFLKPVDEFCVDKGETLAGALNALRVSRLRWLTAVWKTCGNNLAVTTGAERTILWMRWLIAEDLPRFRSPWGAAQDDPHVERFDAQFNSPEAHELLCKLLECWGTLWSRLAFNRMDYKTARLLNSVTLEPPPAAKQFWAPRKLDGVTLLQVRLSQAIAEGCECLFNKNPNLNERGYIKPCAELVMIEKDATSDRKSRFLAIASRAWLLQILLDANDCLGSGVADWSPLHRKLGGREVSDWQAARDYCQTSIDKMHEWLSDELASQPNNQMQHVWLLICLARLELINPESVSADEDFERAYFALDAARSFAKEEPEHRRAIVELYAAQITMAHAEHYLCDGCGSTVTAEHVPAGRNKLEGAFEALGRAHDLLRLGRRNTRWWRHYYNLRARLQIWRLWEGIQSSRLQSNSISQDDSPHTPDERRLEVQRRIVKVLERVRGGLSAIRHRVNLEPKPVLTIPQLKENANYPFRVWQALYYIAAAATSECVRRYDNIKFLDDKHLEPNPDGINLLVDYAGQFRKQYAYFTTSYGLDYGSSQNEAVIYLLPTSVQLGQSMSDVLFDESTNKDLRSYVCLLPRNRPKRSSRPT